MYVNGTAITSTNYTGTTVQSSNTENIVNTSKTDNTTQENSPLKNDYILPIVTIFVITCVVLVYGYCAKKKNSK